MIFLPSAKFLYKPKTVAAWTPLSLPLYGWYKADAGTGVSTDGAAVAIWADQSINNNNLAQATAANQGVFRTGANGVNGLPVLEFPASSTVHRYFQDTLFPGGTATGFSFYIISRNPAYNAAAQYTGAFGIGDLAQGSIHQLCNHPVNPTRQQIRISGSTGNDFGEGVISTNFVVTKVSRGATLNSTKTKTTFTSLQNQIATTNNALQNGFNIGRNYIGSVGSKIAEVIVCNRELTGDEEIKLNTYLRSRYGFDLNYGVDLPVTGAALWLDGSRWDKLYADAGTLLVTADNGAIQQANDLSGNGLHASQSVFGSRPTYRAPLNGVNGLSAIQHSNTGWYFTTASASLGEYTAFSVMTSGWTTGQYRAVFGHNYSGTTGQAFMTTGGDNSPSWLGKYLLATGNGYSNLASVGATGPYGSLTSMSAQLVTAVAGSAGSTVRLNGVSVATSSANQAITPSSAIYYLGYSGLSNDYHDGKTCETIIYPRLLTDAEIVLVENYLKKKWATQNTLLLLSMDGANGSTNFVDSGPNALTVTAVGNAQISTAQSKFPGGSSGYFDGAGDSLTVSGSAGQFAFGTNPFTIEFWLYAQDLTTRQGLYSNNINSSGGLNSGPVFTITGVGSTGKLGVGNVGQADRVQTGNNAILINTWHHIALVREGTSTNQAKIYVDGVMAGQGTMSDNFSVSRDAAVGRTIFYSEFLNGLIDDLRISKKSWYTAPFTPPTSPHISD
jgi:hypothetical protein